MGNEIIRAEQFGDEQNTGMIAISYENDRPTVLGRDLHEKLGIKSRYNDWFARMCEYGFAENEDYILLTQKRVTNNPKNPETTYTDHQLTLDMAKQICMIQRTDEGRRYREYFLDIERRWNDPQAAMARSLLYASRQIESITSALNAANAQLEEAKPKIVFADSVQTSKTSILVGDLSKLLRQNGVLMGQKRLFTWLREHGYLIKGGESYNMPTQRSMEAQLFEIKESSVSNPDGSIRVTKTPKVTGKGQIYFVNLFLRDLEKSAEVEETETSIRS